MRDGTGSDSFYFNGIDGRTGRYLFPPMTGGEIVEGLRRMPKSREKALIPGIDPKKLSETGWGVVFHKDENPDVREALSPLLEHRKAQASQRSEALYREFSGPTGFGDEDKNREAFLNRRGTTSGPVSPRGIPYYLLLVGGPERIPFHFQHQLDLQYAVGRLSFDTPEEYAHYARSVVAAEACVVVRDRRVALFGVSNPDDYATNLSARRLVRPLAERLVNPVDWQQDRNWQVSTILEEEATKARLGRLLGGEETPALLFTASHGMGFPEGDPLQRDQQGALLCQDWPGPQQWDDAIPPDFCFSGNDVNGSSQLHGLVAFFFACNGIGTPAFDEFGISDGKPPRRLTSQPFVTRLPQRLLGHPQGGALAVIGHVDRTWAYSFLGGKSSSQLEAFEWTLRMLMEGYPVGYAMEWFNQRYGELSADLTLAIQQMSYGEKFNEDELAGLWTANNDARNYAVLGDPAVRVAVG